MGSRTEKDTTRIRHTVRVCTGLSNTLPPRTHAHNAICFEWFDIGELGYKNLPRGPMNARAAHGAKTTDEKNEECGIT